MIEIIPAILPESLDDLAARLLRVRGLARRVQIDIVDGVFAPARTWPYTPEGKSEFAALANEANGLPSWQDFDFEVDMMVKNPEAVLDGWLRAGVASVVVHIGSTDAPRAVFETARSANTTIGLAVRPSTPEAEYEPYVREVDFIQFMGNDRIGSSGVPLDPRVPEQIAAFRERHQDAIIGVDIGVNKDTAPMLVAAGANRLAVGSAIFSANDPREAIEYFQNLA